MIEFVFTLMICAAGLVVVSICVAGILLVFNVCKLLLEDCKLLLEELRED